MSNRKLYSNAIPTLEEGDMFVTTVPLDDAFSTELANTQMVKNQVASVALGLTRAGIGK